MFDLRIDGSIAWLRLSRPEVRNAIPLEGWRRLTAVLADAEQSGARALIVAGEPGGAFCAGADINDFSRFAEDVESRSEFRLAMRGALDRLRDLPMPTLALVQGACFGAGVALAVACDIRIGGGAARFGITPARLGIAYLQEDVHQLVALVGAGHAARLLLSADSIDCHEAHRIGLVELCCKGEAEARRWAEAAAANDPDSLRVLKRGIALATLGVRESEQQDRDFDALLGSDAAAARIAGYRNRGR